MTPDTPNRGTAPVPISTIVCDFGGVLTTPLWDAFLAYQDHSGVPLESFWNALGAMASDDGVNPMEELECGRITEAQFTDALGSRIAEQLGRPVDISDFGEVWFGHLHPNEAMLELMRECKTRNYRMVLLTNNVREWEHRWRPVMGIDTIFEVVIDSGFVGLRKPDPEIYALTMERIGNVDPAEILFIDDMGVNVEAARQAGWRAVQFVNNAQAVPEIEAALDTDAPRAD